MLGVTTTVADCLVLNATGQVDNSFRFTAVTFGSWSSGTEQIDVEDATTGNHSFGVAVVSQTQASAGATPTVTGTCSGSRKYVYITVAIQPGTVVSQWVLGPLTLS